MDLSIDDRLKRRKLDALRRGVHHVDADSAVTVHMIGIGKAGATIVADALRSLPLSGPTVSVLVVDISDEGLADVRETAAALPAGRANVDIISLEPLGADVLSDMFQGYSRHLKLEYPFFPWDLDGKGWLPSDAICVTKEGNAKRSYAKALYGHAYYEGARDLSQALRRFGERVQHGQGQSIVCTAFGVGGGTGSGIVVDLARHLTNVVLGRQTLVVGLGVLPCEGDLPHHRGGGLFAALNEFDCLGDEDKNRSLIASCGELFRNPFTAGLLLVPQEHVWRATGDLAKTHRRVNADIVSLLTQRGGVNLMETLRMLNWVAAPSTQHSAARTPWGDKWIHMFGFEDLDDATVSFGSDLRATLGIRATYRPEFIEVRLPAPEHNSAAANVARLEASFSPDVPPQVAGHGRETALQFILPSLRKRDLSWFEASSAVYSRQDRNEKMLDHALLLDQGILLSEPSDCLEGMAGASLCAARSWVAIPMSAMTGAVSATTEADP